MQMGALTADWMALRATAADAALLRAAQTAGFPAAGRGAGKRNPAPARAGRYRGNKPPAARHAAGFSARGNRRSEAPAPPPYANRGGTGPGRRFPAWRHSWERSERRAPAGPALLRSGGASRLA